MKHDKILQDNINLALKAKNLIVEKKLCKDEKEVC